MAQPLRTSQPMQETQETWVWSLGQEDPLEKEMATYSSILAWRILWTEEPGGLQSIVLPRVGHNWSDSKCVCKLPNQTWKRSQCLAGKPGHRDGILESPLLAYAAVQWWIACLLAIKSQLLWQRKGLQWCNSNKLSDALATTRHSPMPGPWLPVLHCFH